MAELRSQHLDYLVRGLLVGLERGLFEEKDMSTLRKLLPEVVDSIRKDLNRFSYASIIHLLNSFSEVHRYSSGHYVKQGFTPAFEYHE